MKISTKTMRGILCFIGVLFLLPPPTVFAQDDLMLMIVPALSGSNRPLKNIITVAKANGKFTDPVAAVNSITDASATNPYLVVIGPGVYTVTSTLAMKGYVDIAGSGQNVTKITGAISSESSSISAIISGVNHSALSSLTVENRGGGTYSVALYNNNAFDSLTISDVTATASGGTRNLGVDNHYSHPTMKGITATASGGTTNYGVYNLSSHPTMKGITATASGGTTNYGVANWLSSFSTMTGVTATASGGTTNYGVHNSLSDPTMTDVTAKASGGTGNDYGVYNLDSHPNIRRSTLNGDTDGLYSTNSIGEPFTTTMVSQSTIINGVGGASPKMCVACDNGSGVALGANCN
jgi:hypothetical protein